MSDLAIISARRILYGFSICLPMYKCSLSTVNLIISAVYVFSQVYDNNILGKTRFETSNPVPDTISRLVSDILIGIL